MFRLSALVIVVTICICVVAPVSGAFAQQSGPGTIPEASASDAGITVYAQQFVTRTFEENGKLIDEIIVPGRPPVDYRAPVAEVPAANPAEGINVLSEVPAFDWSYGCSATSAAMMMGYYDRHGYPNMYTGPTNGGVCPLNNSVWGHAYYPGVTCGECPISASKQGIDGRATRGHVNDYWIDYLNAGPDPYVTGGWAEHSPGDCTADYMGTNQAKYSNSDGSTTFYSYTDGTILCDYIPGSGHQDGCHGMRLFAQSRGYTVLSNCSQYIYGYQGNTKGFTFAQFCAEIDAGRPVLIQVSGHTMLGYGYNTTGNVVYLRDTWDYNEHSMTWGGSYSGMQHYGVVTFQLQPAAVSIVTDADSINVPEGGTAALKVKLSMAPADVVTVSVARYSGDTDISVQSGASLTFTTANWDTYQDVTLAAAQDADTLNGSAIIRCSATGITSKDVTAIESDDDRAVIVDQSSLTIPEAGSGVFNVKLAGPPASTAYVTVARQSGDTDISVQSGAILTFTTANWNAYQPVTVAAAHDPDVIDDSAVIRCSLSGWTSADVNVTATDDDAMSISMMKQQGDGASAGCSSAVVTAVFGDSFYLEADDRSCGVRVHKTGHGLSVGMKAGASGLVMTGPDGERFLEASVVAQSGTGTVDPLGLVNRSMGGGDWMYDQDTGAGQKGITNGIGLSNLGLLVRTCGQIVEQHSGSTSQIRFWNFDTNPGWTLEGLWAWGQPAGLGSHNFDPSSGYTGPNVVGYNLYGDYTDSIFTPYYATTPAIDCSGYGTVRLRFYRWLGVEDSSWDHASVQVSNDGANWTDVWVHSGGSLSEFSWSYQDYDISSVADNQPAVYVRWSMGPTDSSVTYPGWNLDDVEIVGTDAGYCVIDDGSDANLKVTVPMGVTIPLVGTHVTVTGISSCESQASDLYPVLKLRSAADMN